MRVERTEKYKDTTRSARAKRAINRFAIESRFADAEVSFCAPARNRTSNNGLEVRSYIHLTTGASEEKRGSLLTLVFRM